MVPGRPRCWEDSRPPTQWQSPFRQCRTPHTTRRRRRLLPCHCGRAPSANAEPRTKHGKDSQVLSVKVIKVVSAGLTGDARPDVQRYVQTKRGGTEVLRKGCGLL